VGRIVVAALGDSITAGSPLWDPDPGVRSTIESLNERSQWQWWAARCDPRLDLKNHGVYGERTDQIADRLEHAARGADVLVVQGGINDVVQSRSPEEAARTLGRMIERAQTLGLAVAIADVLPWNCAEAQAAAAIDRLNELIRAIAEEREVPCLPFHDTLVDPTDGTRMRPGLCDDGDHPSIAGYRLLGERAFRLPDGL